jgi:K+-transporting ATPase ATPase A chain
MAGSDRQGYAIVAVMGGLAAVSMTLMTAFQLMHHGTVPTAIGSSTEGVETRFGVAGSATFADATTLTSYAGVPRQADRYP